MFNTSAVISIARDNIFILWNLGECGRLGLDNVCEDGRLNQQHPGKESHLSHLIY